MKHPRQTGQGVAWIAMNLGMRVQQRAHGRHQHAGRGAVSAAVADEHDQASIRLREKVVVIPGCKVEGSIPKGDLILPMRGQHLWQEPALRYTQPLEFLVVLRAQMPQLQAALDEGLQNLSIERLLNEVKGPLLNGANQMSVWVGHAA